MTWVQARVQLARPIARPTRKNSLFHVRCSSRPAMTAKRLSRLFQIKLRFSDVILKTEVGFCDLIQRRAEIRVAPATAKAVCVVVAETWKQYCIKKILFKLTKIFSKKLEKLHGTTSRRGGNPALSSCTYTVLLFSCLLCCFLPTVLLSLCLLFAVWLFLCLLQFRRIVMFYFSYVKNANLAWRNKSSPL